MVVKRNGYKRKKERKKDVEKRIAYINLKYNLDQTLQELINNKKRKKP